MPDNQPNIVIEPERRLSDLALRDVWEYRELLYFMIWRDVKVRYKQTALGAGWAILQPILSTVIFSVFFGRFAKIPSDGIPYPIFAYVGMAPWLFFSNALNACSNSLVSNQHLLKKIYFPRLIMPLAAVLSGVIDLALALCVLMVMMHHYGIRPGGAIIILPLFVLLAMATALAAGLWLASVNVKYRDVPHIVPFLIQVWMFATPVVYPSSLIPAKWRTWYGLNPMAGVVEGFRATVLGRGQMHGPLLWVSVSVVGLLLAGAMVYFKKMEPTFADVV
jgi:lipopolysaccharide transport system permease protein